MINEKFSLLSVLMMFCATVFAAGEPVETTKQDIVIAYPAALPKESIL